MNRLRFTVTLLAIAACDQGGKPAAPPAPAPIAPVAPAPTTPTAPASPAEAPAPAPPPIAYTSAPGPAYLGVAGAGLYRLDGGALTRLIAHRYPVKQIVVDRQGAVYAVAIGGMWKIVDGKPQRLDSDQTTLVDQLALGPDGVLWATDRRGVLRWDGAWTEEPAETFGGDLINAIAVDHDGRVWVVQSAALWRLDGDHWSKLDVGFASTATPFFSAIAIHADGTVYVAGSAGTFAFRDGRWRKTGLATRYGSIDELVAGPAGHMAGTGGVGTLAVAEPSGTTRTVELDEGPAQAHRGDVLAIDGGGRTWVATDNGLVIFDRDGGLAQQWLPGTVAGVTGKITALAVVADGPTLPALQAAATGAITGKVLRAGKPVARAAIELCDQPLTMFKGTPCESSTRAYRGTSAADGTFRIDDVPVGTYGFAVKPGAQWIILIGGDCCTALEPGATYDVGAITL
ncbi:MAG: hypothetical protein IPL61_07000 [Myxococcales bacterium]|nr:hypothetical protein [Myxococcales bacterium]